MDRAGDDARRVKIVATLGPASAGGLLVVTHGAPVVARPLTNLMRVHRIGN